MTDLRALWERFRQGQDPAGDFQQACARINTRLRALAPALCAALTATYSAELDAALQADQWPGVYWEDLPEAEAHRGFVRWLQAMPAILMLKTSYWSAGWIPAPALDLSWGSATWRAVLDVLKQQSGTYAMRRLLQDIAAAATADATADAYQQEVFFVSEALEAQQCSEGALALWFFRTLPYAAFGFVYELEEMPLKTIWAEIAFLESDLRCLFPWPGEEY